MPNFMTSLSRDPFVVLRSVFPGGAESSLAQFRQTEETSRYSQAWLRDLAAHFTRVLP
jgi:hypothetical protein